MVQVDKDLCIACGLCFSTHTDFFAMGADGKAEAIKQPVTDEEVVLVQEAIDNCPVTAISHTKVIEMNPQQGEIHEGDAKEETPVEDMPMAA